MPNATYSIAPGRLVVVQQIAHGHCRNITLPVAGRTPLSLLGAPALRMLALLNEEFVLDAALAAVGANDEQHGAVEAGKANVLTDAVWAIGIARAEREPRLD